MKTRGHSFVSPLVRERGRAETVWMLYHMRARLLTGTKKGMCGAQTLRGCCVLLKYKLAKSFPDHPQKSCPHCFVPA